MRTPTSLFLLAALAASPARAAARGARASVVGAAADYNALFDTPPPDGLGLPESFRSAVVTKIPRARRTAAPELDFNGLSVRTVMFSDQPEKIGGALLSVIGRSGESIKAVLSDLSLPGAATALAAASGRGAQVQVIVDYAAAFASGRSRRPELQALAASGAAVTVLRGVSEDFALFDGRLLETGSFSWTAAADAQNYEDAVFRDDAELVSRYAERWARLWPDSKPLDQVQSLRDAPLAAAREPARCPDGGALDYVASSGEAEAAAPILEAKGRKVAVRVLLDRALARSPLAGALRKNGIEARLVAGIGGKGSLNEDFALCRGVRVETPRFSSSSAPDLSAYADEFEYLYGLGQAP